MGDASSRKNQIALRFLWFDFGAIIFYCVLNSSYGWKNFIFSFFFERVGGGDNNNDGDDDDDATTESKYRTVDDGNGSNRFNKMCIMF